MQPTFVLNIFLMLCQLVIIKEAGCLNITGMLEKKRNGV
jgi:hypothetical protein